jgi:O-antigen ligase
MTGGRAARALLSAPPPRPPVPLADGLLALALPLTAWLLDPLAIDAFVAAKTLALHLLLALAGMAALVTVAPAAQQLTPRQRAIAVLALVALPLLLRAALAGAADHLAALLLLITGLVVAARADAGPASRRVLLAAAVLALLPNLAISLLQAAGMEVIGLSPGRLGGRFPTGALFGNEGLLALACALLAPPLLGLCLVGGHWRLPAAILLLAAVTTVLLNRQLTAGIAMLAGVMALGLARAGAWRWCRRGLVAGSVLLAIAAMPAWRAPLWQALSPVSAEQVQAASTQRLGAWAAAEGMWRERPWFGHGFGSYARHGQAYRLAAEQSAGLRLTPPVTATGFAEAHNDYLQLAAEAGVPALLLVWCMLCLLLDGLCRRGRDSIECAALLGVLVAGALAALAWFPLQVPFLALCLLIAAGRGWRQLGASA